MIIDFLAQMPFWGWFVIAAVFLIAEIATGTTFLLWPALAALLLGLVTTVQLEGRWVTQWVLFAGTTVGLGVLGKPYAERWMNTGLTDKPKLNDFAERKVGMRGAVATAFVAGRGRVQLGDTEWQARCEDDAASLSEGSVVEVVAMDGTVLIVKLV
ncbi:MAG: NfeD family protein [Pseudomonadota bacterium]